MIWFSADFHLSHVNIIKYSNRPFKSIEEMDQALINNLMNHVNSGDVLYYLGDLTFKEKIAQDFFELTKNIEIHYIIGNHDSQEVIKLARDHCSSVSNLMDIIIERQPITLCHYAMRVWNKSHFNAWQLFGHSHSKLSPLGKQYDVGVDNNNFCPISFTQLKKIMKNLPDNFNYIPKDEKK